MILSKVSIQNKNIKFEKIDGDRVPSNNSVVDFVEKSWLIFNSKRTSADEEKFEILSEDGALNKLINTMIDNRQKTIENLQNEVKWLISINPTN